MVFKTIVSKFMQFLSGFGMEVVIDLGSSQTRIYVVDKGIVVNEATMLARPKRKKWVGLSAPEVKIESAIAIGDRAKLMKNRESNRIEVIEPVERGIVHDLEVAEEMLAYYFSIVSQIPTRYPKLLKFTVLVAVPSNITDVEKRALRSVLYSAGARKVFMVESAILASIGMGLDMDKNSGLMIVDVGGGKTEISVVSLGGVVVSKNIAIGGIDVDRNIVNFIKMRYGMLIGMLTGERLKKELSDDIDGKSLLVVRGRDLESGLPRTIKVSGNDVVESLTLVNIRIAKTVSEVLDEMPPEIVDDVFGRGVWLIGGGAKTKGLANAIEAETKINVKVADDCQEVVVRGGGMVLEDKKLLSKVWGIVGV